MGERKGLGLGCCIMARRYIVKRGRDGDRGGFDYKRQDGTKYTWTLKNLKFDMLIFNAILCMVQE